MKTWIDGELITAEALNALEQAAADGGGETSWNDVTGKPTSFPPDTHTHSWGEVAGKPTSFPPSAHSHQIEDVDGLQAALDNAGTTPDWDAAIAALNTAVT